MAAGSHGGARASLVSEPGTNHDTSPFTRKERIRMDEALTAANRSTGIRFTVYIGDLGTDTAAGAAAILAQAPDSANSVLIAASPNQRALEIRSGAAASRITDKVCQLGITAATAALAEGDLVDGLISSVNVIASAITGP